MAALRQGSNIRKFLYNSKLSKINRNIRRDTHRSAPGWKKCGKNCPVCPLAIKPTKTVISPITNFSLQIQTPVSCESEKTI